MSATQRTRYALAVAGCALAALAAGCASQHARAASHHTAAPASASPAAPALATDPNGEQCGSLDTDGYCPGDSPSPAQTGPEMLTPGQAETLADDSDTTVGTVTVESVYVTTRPAQDYGSGPANGWYVVVHVKATADQSYTTGWDINTLDFYDLTRGAHYESGNGNSYDALTGRQSNADITATLAAGETATGWMAFDVPSRHGAIVYSPNSDGQPVAEWSY